MSGFAEEPIDPDDPYFMTSCDWGHCDGAATWWRYDRKIGHELPVCNECAYKPTETAS